MFLEFGGDGFVAGVDGDGAFPSGNSFGASAKFQLDLGEVVVDDGIFDFVFGIALGVFFKKLNGALEVGEGEVGFAKFVLDPAEAVLIGAVVGFEVDGFADQLGGFGQNAPETRPSKQFRIGVQKTFGGHKIKAGGGMEDGEQVLDPVIEVDALNLWYGRKKKLQGVSIGQVWKPAAQPGSAAPSPV